MELSSYIHRVLDNLDDKDKVRVLSGLQHDESGVSRMMRNDFKGAATEFQKARTSFAGIRTANGLRGVSTQNLAAAHLGMGNTARAVELSQETISLVSGVPELSPTKANAKRVVREAAISGTTSSSPASLGGLFYAFLLLAIAAAGYWIFGG